MWNVVVPTRFHGKHVLRSGVFIFFCCFLGFLYLFSEISRLETIKHKLEITASRLKSEAAAFLVGDHNVIQKHKQSKDFARDETAVVIYNRISKTGSTSLMGLAYDLCVANRFHAVYVNLTSQRRHASPNPNIMSFSDQMRFVRNVTSWFDVKPVLFHGHVAYIDFTRFGSPVHPLYINVIRRPLDRLVSYYYFLRYGDDFNPNKRRSKAGNKQTFDECIDRRGTDCDPSHLWLQIPYFCGQDAACWIPGSEWALSRAKLNVVSRYLLVGVTELMRDYVAVLEATLPQFFSGAQQLYDQGKRSHLRKTNFKVAPSRKTVATVQSSTVWKMEQDFYDFVRTNFLHIRDTTLSTTDNSQYLEKSHLFQYEKVRPQT